MQNDSTTAPCIGFRWKQDMYTSELALLSLFMSGYV